MKEELYNSGEYGENFKLEVLGVDSCKPAAVDMVY